MMIPTMRNTNRERNQQISGFLLFCMVSMLTQITGGEGLSFLPVFDAIEVTQNLDTITKEKLPTEKIYTAQPFNHVTIPITILTAYSPSTPTLQTNLAMIGFGTRCAHGPPLIG
jgi:hypothetical protein